MSLIRWDPFNNLDRFFNDDFFNRALSTGLRTMGFDLAVDVYEDDKGNVVAEMNLPGVDPEKIDIDVKDTYLQIYGEREDVQETSEKSYYAREIKRGSFSRSIRLPTLVDGDKTKAEYENGILKVIMPKIEIEEKKKKIKIEKKGK